MEMKLTKNLIIKIILCVFMLVFIFSLCSIDLQNDTFYDILIGKEYSQNGIFSIDKFSIHENLKYQTHHLFLDLVIYAIYNVFGFIGTYILEIILTCIIAMLFYTVNNQFTKSKKIAYIITFIQLFMFSPFISLRAQMFSSIFFLIEIIMINKYLYGNLSDRKNKIILAILTLIPILLINFHSGVIFFYYIIIGVYLFNLCNVNLIRIENDKTIDKNKLKKLIYPFVISLPLLLLNPYGINGITYMFKTLNNSFINNSIQEFFPFNIKGVMGIQMFIYFVIQIIPLILSNKKIKLQEILFFSGTLFMSLLSVRHFMFFIITTVVLIPHLEFVLTRMKNWLYFGLNEKGLKGMTVLINVIIFIVIMSAISSRLSQKQYEFIPSKFYPINAVEYIKKNIGYDKVIFNEYTWGSYMMFNDIKVFIDSRCDLYTKEYNQGVNVAEDYMNTVKCKIHYKDIVNKYNIEYFLIPKDEPLTIMLLKDDNYVNIYEDDISYIFKKK